MPPIILHEPSGSSELVPVKYGDDDKVDDDVEADRYSSFDDSESGNDEDFDFRNGEYVIIKYAGKKRVLYFAAVILSINQEDEMFEVYSIF